MKNIIPVILCGGSGTRLWPKSRRNTPKQFQAILGENSMFQETLLRVKDMGKPVIITGDAYRFEVASQAARLGMEVDIVVEPEGRNTAPAVAVAAKMVKERVPHGVMAVLPSDHTIGDQDSFDAALGVAIKAAKQEQLVTFGIKPDRPETGYGYLRVPTQAACAVPVEAFVEKPDADTAAEYLSSGTYLWNSGMFVFRASTMLDALARFEPEVLRHASIAYTNAIMGTDFIFLESEAFKRCKDMSIDYAVMERAKDVSCVMLDARWNDLGGWAAVWQESPQDENNNALKGDVTAIECNDCLIESSDRLVAAVGVSDLVVVDTPDSLLVAHKDQAHLVKNVVNQLEEAGREEHINQKVVQRPWGTYESIDQGERHQVKHIMVRPGESLSKQMHHYRAEHWIIVSGVALVEIDEKEQTLKENESCYIPLGSVHRLTNPGEENLHLIEVQSGSYLGEDDIVRFEDIYGRVA